MKSQKSVSVNWNSRKRTGISAYGVTQNPVNWNLKSIRSLTVFHYKYTPFCNRQFLLWAKGKLKLTKASPTSWGFRGDGNMSFNFPCLKLAITRCSLKTDSRTTFLWWFYDPQRVLSNQSMPVIPFPHKILRISHILGPHLRCGICFASKWYYRDFDTHNWPVVLNWVHDMNVFCLLWASLLPFSVFCASRMGPIFVTVNVFDDLVTGKLTAMAFINWWVYILNSLTASLRWILNTYVAFSFDFTGMLLLITTYQML